MTEGTEEIKGIKREIEDLKREKDFVILAHYYVDGEVQAVADYVGDSFYLAKTAVKVENKNILFAGVRFMGESAKLLNPEKNVYMVDMEADCPMAHMVKKEDIIKIKNEWESAAVVCYVNSTAEIKSLSDVCVTSSNALKVVKALKEKNIFFIPDNNLGRYVAKKCPEKNFIFHDGYCPVHKEITKELISAAKEKHREALVLAHPECTEDALELADFIGSTAQIIDYAKESDKNEFIVATETGVFYDLILKNPQKKFYPVMDGQVCEGMKRVTLKKVRDVLKNCGKGGLAGGDYNNAGSTEVELEADIMEGAVKPLEKMLELG